MSSKVFRIWPALALVLLTVAVWYFAGSTGAQAQSTTPELKISPEWQWMGDTVTLSASGFTPGVRAWAHVSWSPDEVPTCRDVSVVANQVGDDLVADDGTVSFTLTVASPRFQAGDHNYLCVVDREGLGIDLRPERLRVVEPPPVYRMRLDVTGIEQAPDSAYSGAGPMPHNFAVVDGRHSDNWLLPQRRGFFSSAELGSDNADYAIDGVDAAGSGLVVIPAGETEATIPVRILDDNAVEAGILETVVAGLADLDDYDVSSEGGTHTLHIQDNDALHVGTSARPLVTFAQISQRVGEDVGTRNVTVNLSPAPDSDKTILYQVSGTADEGDAADFTISSSGSLSVAANSSSASIPVAVRDDSDDETDETVVLLLKPADGYYVGNTPQHTLTISDNDDPLSVLTVSANSSAVNEGDDILFTVSSDRAVAADLSVSFKVDDRAGAPRLTIPAGGRSVTHAVTTAVGAADAPDTESTIEVVAGAGYSLGNPSSVAVTVRDTQPTVASLTWAGPDAVDEGSDVAFSVSLSRALAEGEVVDVPLRASGVSPSDVDALSLVSGTGVTIRGSGLGPVVRFQGTGAQTASLKWHIRTDTAVEASGERMAVALQSGGSGTNVSGGTSLDAENRSFDVAVSDLDLDPGNPVITVLAQSNTVTEGGNAVFRIVANPAPDADLDVTLNVVDVAGSDFVGQDVEGSGNAVTIKAGNTAATFSFVTLADLNDEPSGDVEVQVVTGSGYQRGSSDRLRVVDEDATRVALSVSVNEVTEGNSENLAVTLGRALEHGEALAVRLTLSGDVTTADYELRCGVAEGVVCSGLDGPQPTLTFTGPKARVGVVEFHALDDAAEVERELESVIVVMSVLSASQLDGGASLVNSRVSFSVRDRNQGVPTVSFERSEFFVMEDVGTFALKLVLSKPLDEDLRVGYTLSGTATRDTSSASVQGKLVDTHGQWYRCEDRLVAGNQVGCSWDARPDGNTDEDEVYLAEVTANAPAVKVPGDAVELRLALSGADLGVRKAAERYVVFWGPVDIWLLGGTGLGGSQDFVIQSEHLFGLRSRPVLENELDENGVFTLSLDRGSANSRGDTFVAVVPCNDDYLEGKFSGAEFDRVQLALRDCNEPAVAGLPPLAGEGLIPPAPQDAGAREGSFYGGVTLAWSQHDPRSGLGLVCDVEITSETDDSGETTFYRTIRCENSLDKPVTRDEYDTCIRVLKETEPNVGAPQRRINCGMGHYDRPADPLLGAAVWGTTRYNAARAFYGFVLNWQRGGGGGAGRPGCDVDLLPYRVVEGAEGEPVRHVGFPEAGAREWLTGESGGEADADCVAGAGVDELDVVFYTPEAGTDEDSPPWSDFEQEWHNSHPVHFAVYVSGMASEYADSGDVVNGEDDPFPAGWRRVSLGSWEVAESDPYRRARGFTTLGLWYPHSDRPPSTASGGVRFPLMEEVSGGKRLTVPRDFAGPDGAVRLFVVPCLPLYSGDTPVQGACEDLPVRLGPLEDVRFDLQSARTGPFGFDREDSFIRYSRGVTVIFRTGAWDDSAARPVSWPVRVHEPTDDCGVESVVPSGGTPADVYWREVTVQGGACDRTDLSLVPVRLSNVSGAASDKLVVYVTGGRTDRLDKVRMERAGLDPSSYGRLGLRERELTIAGGASETLHISPDLANRNDEVWLVAYSCGAGASHGSERCPRVRRNRDTVVYGVSVPPAFVIRVRFAPVAQLRHAELAPVCQGANCDLEVSRDVPVLREAVPEGGASSCDVSSYPAGVSGMVYWPDRLVQGGACAPDGISPVSVSIRNPSAVASQKLVLYTTGGRTAGLEHVQVRRGGRIDGTDDAGEPSGEVGLRKTEMTLDAGGSGSILVDPDLADRDGQVWLLAYRCSEPGAVCPAATAGDDLTTYAVDRRPLFQVLVQFDRDFISISDIRICRGDAPCSTSYPLGRVSRPDGDDCSVVAAHSGGRLYWPDRLVARGACDRDSLDDVPVTFSAPSSTSDERLVVYVTGGRSRGLEEVDVYVDEESGNGANQRLDFSIPVLEDLPLDGAGIRASVTAVTGVLDGKDWVADGLTHPVERKVYNGMKQLAARGGDLAEDVARMSFLDAVDETDYLTVEALKLAAFKGVANDIVDHQEFDDDDGIMDTDRILVIGAALYSDDGAAAVVERLDAGHYKVEEFPFTAADGQALKVFVARNGSERVVPGAAELTRKSVESMKQMMGGSFPVDHVVVFLDDGMFDEWKPKGSNTFGFYWVGAMAVRPDLGLADRPGPAGTVLHEVAHYYWNGSRKWIDEGMAELAVAAFGKSLGVPDERLLRSGVGCEVENLKALDTIEDGGNGNCEYYLGQKLFVELRRILGVAEFRAGVRRLHAMTPAGIDELRGAFENSEVAQRIIDKHWGESSTTEVAESGKLGRLGLFEQRLTIPADGAATVSVNPDLANSDGHVWLLAYRCDAAHGDAGCPVLGSPVRTGYDLPKGPDFAVRVNFTEESGLMPADLKELCRGQHCDIKHPWMRQAEPEIPGIEECGAHLGTFWPDRVVRGGECYVYGGNYTPVTFKADAAEKFVVYVTGGEDRLFDLVQVRGVLGDSVASVAGDNGQPLGMRGLREKLMALAAGGIERTYVRSDMADAAGNVWLFAYRCRTSHGDAGCPLVDRSQIRPSYDLPVRPAFAIRVGFLGAPDADASELYVHCEPDGDFCILIAVFRTADGTSLPGTVEFRADRGALGVAGSTALISTQRHMTDAEGHFFVETLYLPLEGGMVNVEAQLVGTEVVLRKRVGHARNVERISAQVMRCSGDVASCHDGPLIPVEQLLPDQRFVLAVTGYDRSGDVALSAGRLSNEQCYNGPVPPHPTFRLNSTDLRSHGYGTSQPGDRGYVGCAIEVLEDASVGTHGITVSYRLGNGDLITTRVQVVVAQDTSRLGFLGLTGKAQLKSGESGEYTVIGYTMEGTPSSYDGGCLKLALTGPLESSDGGSSADGCLAEEIPGSGVKFTVAAKEDVVYATDASVGVTFDGRSRVMHVLVVPAEDVAPSPVSSSSHISNLTIAPEGSQLRVSWTGSPTPAFASMRAQVWVKIGDVDEFLPGCMGGEPHDVSTHEVFCLLSYGQSGDVYHAAVGYIRHDGSAVPVETAQWVRP